MCQCGGKSSSCACPSFGPEPIIIGLPTIVKASIGSGGQRLIEVGASNENLDKEGDIILQDALLRSASSFIEKGHIDIDHYSELGKKPYYAYMLNIKDPNEWIIGRPLEVRDVGSGKTVVKAELFKNSEFNPDKYRYDSLWKSLQDEPHVKYYASVYGFPGNDTEVKGCAIGKNGAEICATRYLVKSFDWRSLAITKRPINDSLDITTRIVTMKSFAGHILSNKFSSQMILSRALLKARFNDHLTKSCPSTDNGDNVCVWTIRDHYIKCENLDYNLADLYAISTDKLIRS